MTVTRVSLITFFLTASATALSAQWKTLNVPSQYATIQAAVDAARSGATIRIATGQYVEQIRIADKNLTLRGDPGATIVSPAMVTPVALGGPASVPRRPVLSATRGRVHLYGLAFDGLRQGDGNFRFTGVLFVGAGGSVRKCSFTGFRSQSLTSVARPERAVQLVNGPTTGGRIVSCHILDCTFTDNADSMFVGGAPRPNPNILWIVTRIDGNTITGLGPQLVQTNRGIVVGNGVTGVVSDNTVTDHVFLRQTGFSIGIQAGVPDFPPAAGFVMSPLLIAKNTLTRNTVGIVALYNRNSALLCNTVTGGRFGFAGIALSGDRNNIIRNSIDMTGSVVPNAMGVALLGQEFNVPFNTGIASNTRVLSNTITGAVIPVAEQTGVTGTVLRNNRIL